MICRLCLENLNEYLPIFKENGESATESDIAKIIATNFHIELENAVSNKICISCWQHLHDFHQFWLCIERKQETLRDCDVKYDPSSLLLQEGGNEEPTGKWETPPLDAEPVDVKTDITLCEPEINLQCDKDDEASSLEAQEFAEALSDDMSSTGHDSDADFMPKSTRAKRKYTNSKADIKVPRAKRACATKTTKVNISTKAANEANATTSSSSSQRPNLLAISREMDAFIAAKVPDLACCLCAAPLANFNALKKHFRAAHKCIGYVRCCENRYKKRALYVDHLKWHDNPDLFKCVECQKRLRSRNCYENHMATVHPPEDELKFQCEFCPRKFARQYILDYHLISHRNAKREHTCDLCQKSFRSSSELKAHEKRVHLNVFATMCDICGKNFKSKQNFDYHMEYVHNQVERTEVQCEVCDKWLKDARSLFKHMYKHRDEEAGKQYVCNECGAVKATRSTLNSHIRYHHSKDKFKCTLCEKEFKRPLALEEHMATHTGKDLYTCPFCPQTFKSHGNMHNHKKKMHPTEWVRKYSQPTQQQAAAASSVAVCSNYLQPNKDATVV